MTTLRNQAVGAQAVGAYVRRLRERQGLTMAQVAAQAQVSPNYVWRIEAAQVRDPGFAHLAGLLRAVGGSADDVATILLDHLTSAAAEQCAERRLADAPGIVLVPSHDELSSLLQSIRRAFPAGQAQRRANRAFLRALRALVSAWEIAADDPPPGSHAP